MMEIIDIRLECLRLAVQSVAALGNSGSEFSDEAFVARARAFADFVLGTRDAEVIDAVRALADKVRDATA